MKRAAATASLAFLLASGAASAAEVALSAQPGSQAEQVAMSVYGDFVRSTPGSAVETAVADLNGDGVGEVFVRIRAKGTCTGDACHTAVLRHDGAAWRVVFERRSARLETSAPGPGKGGAGMAGIVVDGREAWAWEGRGSYRPVLASVGEVVDLVRAPPKSVADAANQALEAAMPGVMAAARTQGDQVALMGAEVDLRPGAKGWMVRFDSAALCGEALGCPYVVLAPEGKGWRSVLTDYSVGAVALMPSKGDGWRDIGSSDPEGYRTLRFDGRAYRVAATTYPSKVTPAP